jgi:hypothetical protein
VAQIYGATAEKQLNFQRNFHSFGTPWPGSGHFEPKKPSDFLARKIFKEKHGKSSRPAEVFPMSLVSSLYEKTVTVIRNFGRCDFCRAG